MTIQCDACRFYLPQLNRLGNPTTRGECRKLPPKMVCGDGEGWDPTGFFPVVDDDDWCGEFRPRAARAGQRRDDQANAAFDVASQFDATAAAVCGLTGDA